MNDCTQFEQQYLPFRVLVQKSPISGSLTDCPVSVSLEAFSPFIPLDVERSSYPATVLKWRLLGKGPDSIDAEVVANVVNPVLRCAPPTAARRRIDRPWSTGSGDPGAVGILCGTTKPSESETRRADLVVDTFERGDWGAWIAEGAAFDGGPLPWARRATTTMSAVTKGTPS